MSDDRTLGEPETITITDKRRQPKVQVTEVDATVQPVDPEDADHEDDQLEQALSRVDRIQALQEKARQKGVTLSDDEKALLLQLQAEEEQEREDAGPEYDRAAMTAFVIVIDHNGGATASSDLNEHLLIDREATVDDMFAGAQNVIRDIQAATTARHVVFGMQVTAQAMTEKRAAVQTLDRMRTGRPR